MLAEKQLVLGSNWCVFVASAKQLGVWLAVVVVLFTPSGRVKVMLRETLIRLRKRM